MKSKALTHIIPCSRIRLVCLLSLLLTCFSGYAQEFTIRGKELSMRQVIEKIERHSKYLFSYRSDMLEKLPVMDLSCRKMSLPEILDQCFAGLNLDYRIEGNYVALFDRSPSGDNFYKPLEGQVRGSDGEPLQGASVYMDGCLQEITRADGSFHLPVSARKTAVTISYTGYSTRTVLLTNTCYQVVNLEPFFLQLDSVSIPMYPLTLKKFAGGSVQMVNMSCMDHFSSVNILDELSGKIPGMIITQHNGVPGSSYGVLLHGRHSILQGTDPLYIVNGVPINFNDGSMTRIGSGSAQGETGASVLNAFSPSAVAKIEVLKDAAATAIYGSRGVNGVVLLTLNTGNPGKLKENAEFSSGIDWAVRTSPLLNTKQYLALRREAVINDSLPVNATTLPEYYLWDTSRYSDFKRSVIGNTRMKQVARIELSGGNSKTSFLVSGNVLRMSSLFPGSTVYERSFLYSHLQYNSPGERLQLIGSTLFSAENNHLPIEDNSYAMYLAPEVPSFRETSGSPSWNYKGISYLNIPALTNNNYQAGILSLLSGLQANYRILPQLVFRSRLGCYNNQSKENSRLLIAGQDPATRPVGQKYYTGKAGQSLQLDESIEYSERLGPGYLTTAAGVEYQFQRMGYFSRSWNGYTNDQLLESGGDAAVINDNSGFTDYRYAALFSQANYTLNQRYMASLSLRREGSSRLSPNRRWNNFWAIGGSWIFSKESFLHKPGWLSTGKIRGGISTTGNDQIGDNLFAQTYSSTSQVRGYQGLQGVYPTSLYNPGLGWEINYSSNLGVDLGFLHDKISLSVTAYKDWTGNQLVYTNLSSQGGVPGIYNNVPITIVNKGLEFLLRTENLNKTRLKWTSTFTLTLPVNRLTRFPGLASSPYTGSLMVGQSLSVVRGFQYEGVDPATGLFRFKDINRDGQLNNWDQVTAGNTDPRCYGGLDQTLQYKNLEIDLFVEFRTQKGLNPYGQLYRYNPPGSAAPSMLSNGPVGWLDHWRKPGDHVLLQKLTATGNPAASLAMYRYLISSAMLTDASFIRLKKLSLSWRLPARTFGRHVLESRIYLSCQNLLTFTHFPVTDPETQDPMVLPPTRSVMAGIKIGL